MRDIQKFAGIGVALMVFRTSLEIALADLSKAFAHAKQRSDAASEKWDAAGATLAKRGGDLLAKAAELSAAITAMADANRASLEEIAAGYAAARKALPDFARHILGPQPRPRSVDPIDALRNGVTIDRFIHNRE